MLFMKAVGPILKKFLIVKVNLIWVSPAQCVDPLLGK